MNNSPLTERETLLLNALRGFVNEYDTSRGTWPDDMVALLDAGHEAIAAVTGEPRADYGFSRVDLATLKAAEDDFVARIMRAQERVASGRLIG